MSHDPVLYAVSAPTLAALGQVRGNFDEGDVASVGLALYRYRAGAPTVPLGTVLAFGGGGYWEPASRGAVAEFTREITITASGTTSAFRTPVGAYFAAHPDDVHVDISTDGGASWVEQQYGPDYAPYYAGMNNPPFVQPASVQDVASGIFISGGVPPAGWLVRIQWIERTAPFVPRVVGPGRFVFTGTEWVSDLSIPWRPSIAPQTPNGVLIAPGPPGFVPELWRLGRHQGGINRVTAGKTFYGAGRRLLPYFRGPQPNVSDPNAFVLVGTTDIRYPAKCKIKYKVCYYSPTLRARTAFAPETLVRLGNNDNHNGTSTNVRTIDTVFIEPA